MNTTTNNIRLHLPAIPHTITTNEYSHCAFTGKVLRFSPMMRSVGYEVYHYGIETSMSGANVQIDLLTVDEFNKLKLQSYMYLNPLATKEESIAYLADPTQNVGALANWDTPLYKEFNRKLREEIVKHYRSTATDIICLPFGPAHEYAFVGLDYVYIESGIGYSNAFKDFRIYESYAILHYDCHRANINPPNYWFVCPNYYNIEEWSFQPICKKAIGFFGRLLESKGLQIIVEIAKIFPDVDIYICGQGDATPYLSQHNIKYQKPLNGKDRWNYLSQLSAVITPTLFLEPFCGVSVEAQLCGVPVISSHHGAFVENIEQFKTGIRCHTLSDYCYGVQMALNGMFDRKYIHERAVRLFDMYNVAKQYDYTLRSINDIYNGNNGWYSPNVNILALEPSFNTDDHNIDTDIDTNIDTNISTIN
jgi:hypothetical protein